MEFCSGSVVYSGVDRNSTHLARIDATGSSNPVEPHTVAIAPLCT